MGRIHAIAILLAIGGGTAMWLSLSRSDDVAPPLERGPAARDPARPAPEPAARVDRTDVAGGTADKAPAPSAPQEAGTAAPGAAVTAANVLLRAGDLAHKSPLPRFRWTFAAATGAALRGQGSDGVAELHLPAASAGHLLVEADGMLAHDRTITVPAALAPALQLDVYLEQKPVATGVSLVARDPQGAPVTRLRIDLWQLPADAAPTADTADPAGEPLWKRGADAADGVFTLPSLASGNYALRAQPVDRDDVALPLQPWRTRFAFAGNEALPFEVAFAAGVVLRIDGDGNGNGEEQLCDVTVATAAGQQPVAWRSRAATGRSVVGADVVVLPGAASTLLALPPGDYRVELQCAGKPVALTPADVAGAVRTYRAALPR